MMTNFRYLLIGAMSFAFMVYAGASLAQSYDAYAGYGFRSAVSSPYSPKKPEECQNLAIRAATSASESRPGGSRFSETL